MIKKNLLHQRTKEILKCQTENVISRIVAFRQKSWSFPPLQKRLDNEVQELSLKSWAVLLRQKLAKYLVWIVQFFLHVCISCSVHLSWKTDTRKSAKVAEREKKKREVSAVDG